MIKINQGDRFGKWTVIERSDKTDKKGNIYYLCRCDCGNVKEVRASRLKNGESKSCGCVWKKDVTGQKVKRLTFIKPTNGRKNREVIWECKCNCGNTCYRTISEAKNIGSCGEHQGEQGIKNFQKMHYVENTCLERLTNKIYKNNKSGVKGVCWNKRLQKWQVQIRLKNHNYYIGIYSNIEDAIDARKNAEKELFEPILEKYKYK